MRCLACDEPMTDRDASRKFAGSGQYVDLCLHCYDTIKDQVPTIENTKAKNIIEEEGD